MKIAIAIAVSTLVLAGCAAAPSTQEVYGRWVIVLNQTRHATGCMSPLVQRGGRSPVGATWVVARSAASGGGARQRAS